MYMGVILKKFYLTIQFIRAPHVYGGDPILRRYQLCFIKCSPCIWG